MHGVLPVHIFIKCNTYIDLKLIPKHICVLEDILYFINNKLTIYNLNYNKFNETPYFDFCLYKSCVL